MSLSVAVTMTGVVEMLFRDINGQLVNVEMRFIEVNGDLVSLSSIIKITPPIEPLECGDWAITFHLADGSKEFDYEVSYQAIMDRYEHIKLMLGAKS